LDDGFCCSFALQGSAAYKPVPELAQQLFFLGPLSLDRLIVRTLTFEGTHRLSLLQPEATRPNQAA
jgi:hypothetical protein